MAEGAWDEASLGDLIGDLQTRFKPLHDKIEWRRKHFNGDPSVLPKLPPPYDKMEVFQSDYPRQVWTALKARLTENPPVINTEAPTEGQRQNAQKLETVLNDGYELVEEREGVNILGALSDGLIVDCYAVLHWRKASDIWPELPEENYLDAPPDKEQKKSYHITPEREGPNKGKYKEREESHRSRREHAKARAGFPWHVEAVEPTAFYFVEDRSLSNGFAVGLTIHEVPMLEYKNSLTGSLDHKGDPIVSLYQEDERIKVFTERDGPADEAGGGYKQRVKVATVWFRDCFYELVATHTGTSWTLVKYSEHPYEMPPFALVPADTFNTSDIVAKYLPALEGVYRTKPQFDAALAYLNALAYSTAIPRYYIRNTTSGTPKLGEDGNTLFLTANSEMASRMAPGEELVKVEFQVNEAYIRVVETVMEQMKESAPSTGEAEITAATKPWTANLSQEQAAVSPRMYLANIARGVKAMVRNWALVMSKPADEGGFGEPIATYAKTKDGKRDTRNIVSVAPEDIPSLMVDLRISGTSRSQRMTLEQHGLELKAAGVVTLYQYLEDYKGSEDPGKDYLELMADQAFMTEIMPGLIKQELAKAGLLEVAVGPDGLMIGPNGEQVLPEEVLGRNGLPAVPPPPPPVQPGMPGASPVPTQIGAMPPLQAEGQMPIAGPVG